MKVLNKNEFESLVLNSKGLVLVDFFAEWCGPCKMMGPVLEQASKELPQCPIYKVNVDDEGELAYSYKVSSIPNLILFKDGKPIQTSLGYKPKEMIIDWIKQNL